MSKKAVRAKVVARHDVTMTYEIFANEIEFGVCEDDLFTDFTGDVEIKKILDDGTSKAMSVREFLDENECIIAHGYDKTYDNAERLDFYSRNGDIVVNII